MSNVHSLKDQEKRSKKIRNTLESISRLKVQRDEINSKMKAEYDKLEADGLSRKAVKDAARMMSLDEEKRFDYEKTKAIVYHAMGWQFQPDLFAHEGESNITPLPGIGQENVDLIADDDGDFTDEELEEQADLAAR